uniref:Run domain Beclin-1 interacting and cystein-rich containing protein n=1 Tax=Lygus hesperus TaxID=30085 RepID=A0A146LY27_LYGHE
MMDDCRRQLLQNLKSVVEGLLCCQVPNVWNVYGGLSRLHSVLERIFKHQFQIFKPNGEEDCWLFIEGLKWLQPSLATSPSPISPNSPPPHPHTDKGMIWLHNSLETHSLSSKLAWLVSDEKHLAFCYSEEAFLRHSQCVEAALICLRAVEQNQLSLLTEIHPTLYLPKQSLRAQEKYHRRCSSYPDSAMQRSPSLWASKSSHQGKAQELRELSDSAHSQFPSPVPVVESEIAEEVHPAEEVLVLPPPTEVVRLPGTFLKVKPWRSLPCLSEDGQILQSPIIEPYKRNKTEPSSPSKEMKRSDLALHSLNINYNSLADGKGTTVVKGKRKEKQLKRTAGSTSSGESVETVRGTYSRSIRVERRKRQTFMDDGGSSIRPMSTGAYLPRPADGQSLTSFLSSSLHTERSTAELDRENAHFSVSEAIIAAIEQVKCNRWEKCMEEVEEESDEEIRELKTRIRVRRKIKQEEKHNSNYVSWHASPSDNTPTDSFSPRSTDTDGGTDDSISTDGVDDMDIDQVPVSVLADMNKSGLSLSMASLYSDLDLGKGHVPAQSGSILIPSPPTPRLPSTPTTASPDQSNSAELVALSLLAKFSDRHLPKASEMEWLVSEKEAPQQLLPLPGSILADDDMNDSTPLRGTSQWAPPRPQIIFTPHPPPQRRTLLSKQNLRCAGCGMKVAPEYAHRFRYCEYLARYFCTGCHSNKEALIPGRILFKWDFRSYPVSNFSFNLLEQMASDPLFNIGDINANIYNRVKVMERIRTLRLQLHFLKDFLLTCKFTDGTKQRMEQESPYMLMDIDVYSINDLVQVRNGMLSQRLSQLVVDATLHVAKCDLCQARGFICELCRTHDIIFPWQLGKVTRCSKCFSCQHTSCLRKKSAPTCPKCERIKMRLSTNSSR